jgi:hypothetical protein
MTPGAISAVHASDQGYRVRRMREIRTSGAMRGSRPRREGHGLRHRHMAKAVGNSYSPMPALDPGLLSTRPVNVLAATLEQ